MVTTGGRSKIVEWISQAFQSGGGAYIRPYKTGPSTDPTDNNIAHYTAGGPFDEGTTQALSLTLPGPGVDPRTLALGSTTWTVSSGASLPQTINGAVVEGVDFDGFPVFVGPIVFTSPVVLTAVGQQMVITADYLEGLLAP